MRKKLRLGDPYFAVFIPAASSLRNFKPLYYMELTLSQRTSQQLLDAFCRVLGIADRHQIFPMCW